MTTRPVTISNVVMSVLSNVTVEIYTENMEKQLIFVLISFLRTASKQSVPLTGFPKLSITQMVTEVCSSIVSQSTEFFTIHVSVRLSDRSKVTQSKINFVKNCPQGGLNSQPPDHQSTALSTVQSHYLVVLVNH